MRTPLLHFQQLRNGLPSLNVAVPALKMIHVKDIQKVQQPEIIEQVHDMVLDDWRMKVREIAETIGVSKECVGYILLDGTSVRLLYLRASRRNSEYTSVRGLEVGEEILVYVKVQLE